MPSEAEIEAAIRADLWGADIHAIVDAVNEASDAGDMSTEQCVALGVLLERGRLSAASAVRSEPVAWIKTHPQDNRRRVDLHDELDPWMIDEGGWSVTPLWPIATSPVQTREDGIREALRDIERVLRQSVISRADIEWCANRASSLLSQPEPRGDKA